MGMFCFQCEQTAGGTGCTKRGVCGKDDVTARLQDVLIKQTKGIAFWANRAREHCGVVDNEVDRHVVTALFATVTNVDFDPARLQEHLKQGKAIMDKIRSQCAECGEPEELPEEATFQSDASLDGLLAQAEDAAIDKRREELGPDVVSLQEIIAYGLKGAAAYADHAKVLGKESEELYGLFHADLAFITRKDASVDELTQWALKTGEVNLKAMEILDAANTEAYGHPEPTGVRIEPVKGKAIVVSGHDLKDLKMLLEQTEGKGVNIYTHGEMLPAHGYPELKKHKHLVGNYGGAWQDQQKEFDAFPGAILMTTNCIQKPLENYSNRIYTTGLVAWPDVNHIEADADGNKDFTPVIEAALAAPGFTDDGSDKTIMVGFARNAVLGVADKVIEAVKGGNIRHFFLVGGCDGAKPGRNYYTEFVEKTPKDTIVLTLACGKYRFNKLDLGEIGGIPRLLDIGQCNDAYSAIQIAVALAGAFDCEVNELPLSLVLSWYEQKAVAILLTLLHLGIKNIRIGPSLPAFVSDNVLQVLVDNFDIKPVSTPDEDLQAILG